MYLNLKRDKEDGVPFVLRRWVGWAVGLLLLGESVLLLAYGAVGARADVARLRRQIREQGETPFWFFHRMEAVVLTMLERWQDLAEVLPSLERVAARGSPYLEALLGAIHEEMGAARGGSTPAHGKLRELGYAGWSQLLAHRPAAP